MWIKKKKKGHSMNYASYAVYFTVSADKLLTFTLCTYLF